MFVIHMPQTAWTAHQRAQLKRYRQQLQAQRDQLIRDFPRRLADFQPAAVS